IDLALKNVWRFSLEEVLAFKAYVTQKAWWDSVDAWRNVFGSWVVLHLTELTTIFALFYSAEKFWNQRVALNLKLILKEKPNQD
ncbi:DNA alkylation repair protein, partial [Enterococcus faecalis]|uniref:DNA alkylation repair protein n=1 Tax=Enterococcus faecalis TaxID=1351 RepID=UPI0029585390